MEEKKPYRIENWSIRRCMPSPDYQGHIGYMAPEVMPICLSGYVFGHPKFQDGDDIDSSAITDAKGKLVFTASGSSYMLGEPNQKWLAWMKDQGKVYDPENPITIWR